METYNDRKTEMIHASMQMISHCGEADKRIHEALKRQIRIISQESKAC